MNAMAGVASVRSRIEAHCTVIITAQRKKQRLHLRKSVCAARRQRAFASTPASTSTSRAHHHVDLRNIARSIEALKSHDETSISCVSDNRPHRKNVRLKMKCKCKFPTRDTSIHAQSGNEKFCTGSIIAPVAGR
jgi:hypothetical protein